MSHETYEEFILEQYAERYKEIVTRVAAKNRKELLNIKTDILNQYTRMRETQGSKFAGILLITKDFKGPYDLPCYPVPSFLRFHELGVSIASDSNYTISFELISSTHGKLV